MDLKKKLARLGPLTPRTGTGVVAVADERPVPEVKPGVEQASATGVLVTTAGASDDRCDMPKRAEALHERLVSPAAHDATALQRAALAGEPVERLRAEPTHDSRVPHRGSAAAALVGPVVAPIAATPVRPLVAPVAAAPVDPLVPSVAAAPAGPVVARGARPPSLQSSPPPSSASPTRTGGNVDRLRRGLATLKPKSVGAPSAQQSSTRAKNTALPAEARDTPYGTLHVRAHHLAADHRHGVAEVRAALEAEPSLVAALALDPALRDVDLRGMLLLDTETTGLAGGTGTLPFVLGLGWFEGDRLRIDQLLLRRPGEEAPMLRYLEERLATATCLVSYNGKTFDWPLLRNRFVMNRLKAPAPKPHLDLLHCARRVFRHRPGGAKLTHLEAQVLRHRRIGDVPGEEIPELYFRYLRTGNGGLLEPVLEHNAHDMVLLAALLGVIARQFRAGCSSGDPRDDLGYATVAARAGDVDRAMAFAKSAATASDRTICADALALAAEVSKRRGDVQSAVQALESAVQVASGELLATLHLELAKLYEHQLRSAQRALDHARHTLLAEGREAHHRRLDRLRRKMNGAQIEMTSPGSGRGAV